MHACYVCEEKGEKNERDTLVALLRSSRHRCHCNKISAVDVNFERLEFAGKSSKWTLRLGGSGEVGASFADVVLHAQDL